MRAELALVAVLLSGCSVASMERLGAYRRDATPHCSTNRVPVVIDGLIATGLGGMTVAMTIPADRDRDSVAMGALAVTAVASAVYGWRESARCRRAFDDHDQYLELETRMRAPIGAPGSVEPQ